MPVDMVLDLVQRRLLDVLDSDESTCSVRDTTSGESDMHSPVLDSDTDHTMSDTSSGEFSIDVSSARKRRYR